MQHASPARIGPLPPARQGRCIIGIDGEGVGRAPHRYVFLAAADAGAPGIPPRAWSVSAPVGGRLSTIQCLDIILSLPDRALIVGFAFAGYDVTKILGDLPTDMLYRLVHPDSRKRLVDGVERTMPEQWEGYRINIVNRSLTVGRGKRRRTVHDVFKFFQCSFVKALTDWQVATDGELTRMRSMKAQRSEFDSHDLSEVADYCREECTYLSRLFAKLLAAHETAGIKLGRYDGPGSSAKVLLGKMGVLKHRGEIPAAMEDAVKRGYFGGRFEHARTGAVRGRIWSYDLASAYPYAATELPCLAHGRWRLVDKPTARQLDRCTAALVHWTGGAVKDAPWGALPVRTDDGSIVFPLAGAGGWAWFPEFDAARRHFGNFRATAAWIFDGCDCPPPFAALAQVYRDRVQLGKDGAGRALKLASNSCYGVLCQSVGKAPFRSLAWAGMITAATRAELLTMMAPAPAEVLMLATDGLYSRRRLPCRAPRDTGTGDLPVSLGAWEEKIASRDGVFLVRPGIYFPLGAEKTEEIRARGIAKPSLLAVMSGMMAAHKSGAGAFLVDGMQRFCGAKSSLHAHEDGTVARSPDYGEWVPHPVELRFTPLPKRTRAVRGRLLTWKRTAWESCAYESAAPPSPDARALRGLDELLSEQPDGEFEG